jgi:predicted nuclease of restriction endonuclease-like RecB superfamily
MRPLPKELRIQVDEAKKKILEHPNRKHRWASDYAEKFGIDVKVCLRAIWELNEEASGKR